MKHFIQNTFLNRVLLALAVSVAAGGVASASPAGTLTCTVTTPVDYSTITANYPTTFDGSISATANGVNATATFDCYFLSSFRAKYPINNGYYDVYVNVPINPTIATQNGPSLPAGNYTAHLDCTLSAPGRTDVPNSAAKRFTAQ